MSEPVSHRARLSYPRLTAATIEATRHDSRSGLFYVALVLAVLVLAVWLGHMIAFRLAQELPLEWMFSVGPYLPTIVPVVLAFAGLLIVGRMQRAFEARKIWAEAKAHGIPLEFDALYELHPDELRMSSDRAAIAHKWATVDAITDTTHGWVISANCLMCLIPHDSFADVADERAFVAALVAHLTDAARARSAYAVTFAG